MAAFKDCHPYDPQRFELGSAMFASSTNRHYSFGKAGQKAVRYLIEKCSPHLDQ